MRLEIFFVFTKTYVNKQPAQIIKHIYKIFLAISYPQDRGLTKIAKY
jgi:hypothetical protein